MQTLARKDFEAYEYRRFLINIIQIFSGNNWDRPALLKVLINKVICGELKKIPLKRVAVEGEMLEVIRHCMRVRTNFVLNPNDLNITVTNGMPQSK